MTSMTGSADPMGIRRVSKTATSRRAWSAPGRTPIWILVSAAVLVSCAAPTPETPPFARTTRASSPRAVPTETQTPTPSSTAAPTENPTLGPIVLPTPPPNGVTLTLSADENETGWVASGGTAPFSPDNSLSVGVLKGQAYESIVQFDVTRLAPGSKIDFAALELSGRNANSLAAQGEWHLDLLDTATTSWNGATFDTIRQVPVLIPITAPLASGELEAGARKRFVFTSDQLAALQKQIDVGTVAVRLSGPTQGDDDLFVWDATPGVRQPTLYLVAQPAAFAVITGTPTPADVFAAATRVVAQTLQASLFGTPTALPRT
ncbi:MAG: hypothetical protein M1482_02575, partial [Chloroflexi bacterium]|nr:hypothetical protein [Chloroflexota bacterium]